MYTLSQWTSLFVNKPPHVIFRFRHLIFIIVIIIIISSWSSLLLLLMFFTSYSDIYPSQRSGKPDHPTFSGISVPRSVASPLPYSVNPLFVFSFPCFLDKLVNWCGRALDTDVEGAWQLSSVMQLMQLRHCTRKTYWVDAGKYLICY